MSSLGLSRSNCEIWLLSDATEALDKVAGARPVNLLPEVEARCCLRSGGDSILSS